jgi:outer membrane protein assembly factor BamB
MGERSIRCPGCGADWPAPGSRYCGRCGQVLRPASGPGTDAEAPRSIERWVVIAAAVAVAATAVIAVAVVGPLSDDQAAPEEAPWEVELPGLPDPRENSAPPASAPTLISDLFPFACEPEGCAIWEARIGDGAYTVADGVIVQSTASALRALDPATGDTRWRVTYVEDDLPPLLTRPEVRILGDDLVIVTSMGGLLRARSLTSGELLWHGDLDVEGILEVADHGEVIVAAGFPIGQNRQPPVLVASFHRESGTRLWESPVHRAVALGSDPMILQPRSLDLTGVDPATGMAIWNRSVIGPVRGLAGDDMVVVVSPAGVSVVDPRSGDELRRVPRAVTDTGLTRLAGGLLLVDAPSGPDPGSKPRSDMTVVPIAEVDRDVEPRRFADTTGFAVVDGGIVILTQDDRQRTLHRLDLDGTPRWSWSVGPGGDHCCWTLQGGPSPAAVYLVPPGLDHGRVEVIDATDGAALATFRVPVADGDSEVEWLDGLALEARPRRTVLSGPGGRVELATGSRLLTTSPQPIVIVEGGLLALDATILSRDP